MTVYVVQNQRSVGPDGRLRPKFDLSPAKRFGAIVDLLNEGHSPAQVEEALALLQERLKDFGDDDYLLLIGNPVMIGLAVACAAVANDGNVQMLQWSGVRREYQPIRVRSVL